MIGTFHLFFDNFRIYRSAYELDLAYAKTEYVEPTSNLDAYFDNSFVALPEPSVNIDGTFESYVASLDAIGFAVQYPLTDPAEDWRKIPYGTLPLDAAYVGVNPSPNVTVNTSLDHTRSDDSTKCLQVALPGTGDAANRCFRAGIYTAIC